MKFNHNILEAYLLGIATPEETRAVKEWYELSEENRNIFREEQQLVNTMLLLSPDLDDGERKVSGRRHSAFRRIWVGVAAAVALIVSVPIVAYLVRPHQLLTQTITVPEGQRVKVDLPDGSIVWLNSQSSLTYSSDFMKKDRTVSLKGEGYFDIMHDEKHPFVVETGNIVVRDIGTCFDIRDYPGSESATVSLLEGQAAVATPGSEKEILLSPGEQAVLGKDGKIVVEKIENPDLTSWIDGIYSFRSKNLEQIIADLEDIYKVKIEIGEVESVSRTYSGKFRISGGLNSILDVLSEEYGFKYHAKEGEVNIY